MSELQKWVSDRLGERPESRSFVSYKSG